MARDWGVGDPQMGTAVRDRVGEGQVDGHYNRLWARAGMARYEHTGW